MAAREQGVLVRGLGRGVAVSPPLTATAEHFGLVHDALAQALVQALSCYEAGGIHQLPTAGGFSCGARGW